MFGKSGMREGLNYSTRELSSDDGKFLGVNLVEFHKRSSMSARLNQTIFCRWLTMELIRHIFTIDVGGITTTDDKKIYDMSIAAFLQGSDRYLFLSCLFGLCLRYPLRKSIIDNKLYFQTIWIDFINAAENISEQHKVANRIWIHGLNYLTANDNNDTTRNEIFATFSMMVKFNATGKSSLYYLLIPDKQYLVIRAMVFAEMLQQHKYQQLKFYIIESITPGYLKKLEARQLKTEAEQQEKTQVNNQEKNEHKRNQYDQSGIKTARGSIFVQEKKSKIKQAMSKPLPVTDRNRIIARRTEQLQAIFNLEIEYDKSAYKELMDTQRQELTSQSTTHCNVGVRPQTSHIENNFCLSQYCQNKNEWSSLRLASQDKMNSKFMYFFKIRTEQGDILSVLLPLEIYLAKNLWKYFHERITENFFSLWN